MYIKPKKFYGALLPLLNKKTPMKENCGDLCGARCCKDSDDGEGMYLYPHEAEYLGDVSDFAKIFLSDFQVCGKRTEILTCGGNCIREKRPLACRIFPLVPYISPEGDFFVIFDPRAYSMCPLAKKGVDRSFSERVYFVCKALLKVSECREFIFEQSRIIDDFIEMKRNFFYKK